MNLKEFLEYYDVFYKNDIDAIVGWAAYNNCQAELVSAISALATSLVQEKQSLEWQIKEWSAYAMNLVPDITREMDFTTAINALRLAYFAYNGEQFVNFTNKLMEEVDSITWPIVENMHPMIWLKYKGLTDGSPQN